MRLKVTRDAYGNYQLFVPRGTEDYANHWVSIGVANTNVSATHSLVDLCQTFEQVTGIILVPGTEKIFDVRLNKPAKEVK